MCGTQEPAAPHPPGAAALPVAGALLALVVEVPFEVVGIVGGRQSGWETPCTQ